MDFITKKDDYDLLFKIISFSIMNCMGP